MYSINFIFLHLHIPQIINSIKDYYILRYEIGVSTNTNYQIGIYLLL